jgi:TRAP-type C4-dicarboxylate transport system permease small subunit
MSRTWKWIIGILVALVVIGIAVGSVFMWQNHMTWWGPRALTFSAPTSPGGQGQEQGVPAPYDDDVYPRYHMRSWGGHMPMMYGGGYGAPYVAGPFGTGFMLLFGLLRLLIPLGVLALVAYLFYQMGKRAGATTSSGAPMPDVRSLPARKVARR